jgi:AcrR family transcriptional regulator
VEFFKGLRRVYSGAVDTICDDVGVSQGRDRELRRRQIAAGARSVFADKGSTVSVRDVAKATGTTEAAIFRLYSSKEELFEAAILVPLEDLTRDLGRIAERFMPATLHERMKLGRDFQYQLGLVVDRITPLLWVALFSRGGRAFYRERMGPLLEEAARVTSLALSPVTRRSVDARTVFIAMMGMHLGLAVDARLGGGVGGDPTEVDWAEAAKAITDVLAFGLLETEPEARLARTARRYPPTGRTGLHPAAG